MFSFGFFCFDKILCYNIFFHDQYVAIESAARRSHTHRNLFFGLVVGSNRLQNES